MDTKRLVAGFSSIATNLIDMVPYGKQVRTVANVVAAQMKAFKETAEDLDDEDIATLDRDRERLEAAVNAHADSTADKLKG